MALTFGYYVHEDYARLLAVTAVLAFTGINVLGVTKTARLVTFLVIAVIATVSLPVLSTLGLDDFRVTRAFPQGSPPGGLGVLEGSALLFFAFAGYARIATSGEEVVDPARTIPRAIPIALGVTLLIYALVIGSALIALGPDALAESAAPLADVVVAAGMTAAGADYPGWRRSGISKRLAFATGRSRPHDVCDGAPTDFPAWLDAVHPRYRVPYRAEVVIGCVVALLAATLDLRSAIGFSSFAVLLYYTIANASAWTLSGDERRWPRWIAALGIVGCLGLAISLPLTTLLSGMARLRRRCHRLLLASASRGQRGALIRG